MRHNCEDFTSGVMGELRSAVLSCPAANNSRFSREAYFSWDEDQGSVELDLSSSAGDLLEFDARVGGSPSWFSLNFGLGRGRFSVGDTLVIVMDAEAEAPFEASAHIRSAINGGVEDTYLDEGFKFIKDRAVTVLLHRIEPSDALSEAEGFHTLTLLLPKSDLKVALYDLGLFVTPATAGQVPSQIRLSSFG